MTSRFLPSSVYDVGTVLRIHGCEFHLLEIGSRIYVRLRAGNLEYGGWTVNPNEWMLSSGLRQIEDLVERIFQVKLRRWIDVGYYNSTPWGEESFEFVRQRPMHFHGGRGCSYWQHSSSVMRYGMEDYSRMIRYVTSSEIISSERHWEMVRREIMLSDSGDVLNCFCEEKLLYILLRVRFGGEKVDALESILGLGVVELYLWRLEIVNRMSMPYVESLGFTELMSSSDEEEDFGQDPFDDIPEEVNHAQHEGEYNKELRKESCGLGIVQLLMRREQGFAPNRADKRSYAEIYYVRVEDLWMRGREGRGDEAN